jgi:hypothetical protein
MEKVFHEKSSEEKILPDPSGTNILKNKYTLTVVIFDFILKEDHQQTIQPKLGKILKLDQWFYHRF